MSTEKHNMRGKKVLLIDDEHLDAFLLNARDGEEMTFAGPEQAGSSGGLQERSIAVITQ